MRWCDCELTFVKEEMIGYDYELTIAKDKWLDMAN